MSLHAAGQAVLKQASRGCAFCMPDEVVAQGGRAWCVEYEPAPAKTGVSQAQHGLRVIRVRDLLGLDGVGTSSVHRAGRPPINVARPVAVREAA